MNEYVGKMVRCTLDADGPFGHLNGLYGRVRAVTDGFTVPQLRCAIVMEHHMAYSANVGDGFVRIEEMFLDEGDFQVSELAEDECRRLNYNTWITRQRAYIEGLEV